MTCQRAGLAITPGRVAAASPNHSHGARKDPSPREVGTSRSLRLNLISWSVRALGPLAHRKDCIEQRVTRRDCARPGYQERLTAPGPTDAMHRSFVLEVLALGPPRLATLEHERCLASQRAPRIEAKDGPEARLHRQLPLLGPCARSRLLISASTRPHSAASASIARWDALTPRSYDVECGSSSASSTPASSSTCTGFVR